jgi:CMP-N-acetylneuraminic acid synthetase
MKIAALIPARSGSKGIPNKNFKDFCGKELWQWSKDAAEESGIFDEIFVSRDEDRPSELCDDKASLDAVLDYYKEMHPDVEVWCLLQPTSPLRTADDIKRAWELFNTKGEDGEFKYESLVSTFPHPGFVWIKNAVGIPGDDDNPQPIATYHYNKRPNRQDREDWSLENGAIYFTRKYILDLFQSRLQGTIAVYDMPKERSIEIDDEYDWFLAEQTMRLYHAVG